MAQLRMLLGFLEVTGIIVCENGEVRLNRDAGQQPQELPKPEDKKLVDAITAGQVPVTFTTQEEHSLFLDKERTKKFSMSSPLFISKAEYERICKWIAVTLIVDDEDKTP
jgi:hypothetical protein